MAATGAHVSSTSPGRRARQSERQLGELLAGGKAIPGRCGDGVATGRMLSLRYLHENVVSTVAPAYHRLDARIGEPGLRARIGCDGWSLST